MLKLLSEEFVYCCIIFYVCKFLAAFYDFRYFSYLSCGTLDLQMLMLTQTYISFGDGASRSTQNFSSIPWVIYSPTYELVSIHGICLDWTTNNIVEYSATIELLSNATSFDIFWLIVRLYS